MTLTDRSRFELLGLLDDPSMDVVRDAHPEVLHALLDGSRHGLRATDYSGVDDVALGCFDGTLLSLLEMLWPGANWRGARRKEWWER